VAVEHNTRRVDSAMPPYVPVDGSPWHLSMGLRRLDPARWLEVDANRARDLSKKAALLTNDPSTVLAVLPHGWDAAEELADLVMAYLDEHHPGLVDLRGPQDREPHSGSPVAHGSLHPIAAASLLVQEDLCVLEQLDDEWRLTAACVCFPSRWSLTEKLGATLGEIHAPVPGFADELGAPATRFFDRLSVERPVWRLNWTLLDTPEFFLPSASARHEAPSTGRLMDDLWFRVERQTLRRLPGTDAIVFTIRTYVTALRELVSAHPESAEALASTLQTVPGAVATYKGWTGLLGPLVAALRAPSPAAPV
jgi:dimethylamine monooxygenase subunit A